MGYKSRLKQAKRLSNPEIRTQEDIHNRFITYFEEKNKQENWLWLSMEREAKAIELHKYDLQSSYQAARLLLYKALLLDRIEQLQLVEGDLTGQTGIPPSIGVLTLAAG